MSNASTAAVRRGWEIFRARPHRPSLEEINARLEAEGLAPPEISVRSFRHYRAMDARGIVDYMTINEFDQWSKANRFTSTRDIVGDRESEGRI
jgi:hypothetical protein